METLNYEIMKMSTRKFYIENIKKKNNLPNPGFCSHCNFISNKVFCNKFFLFKIINKDLSIN